MQQAAQQFSQFDSPLSINLGKEEETNYKLVRRNGSVVAFDRAKIFEALNKAFQAVKGDSVCESLAIKEAISDITDKVVLSLKKRYPQSVTFNIEAVQDQVELMLMRAEHYDIAKAYVVYREKRAEERRKKAQQLIDETIHVITSAGEKKLLDVQSLIDKIKVGRQGLDSINESKVLQNIFVDLYDGVHEKDVNLAMVMASRSLIELEPEYSKLSARFLLDELRREIFGRSVAFDEMEGLYASHLETMIYQGIEAGLINRKLLEKFDLKKLGKEIDYKQDLQFEYLGLQTLYDRYFIHKDKKRIEMPQSFFMRVAMGLALNEDKPTERALEFYKLLSSFRFMSSTPTLFNSATMHSQLSSCYLTTVPDALDDIFMAYQENALLAKYAGGLGNDWTPIRAMGSWIKGTNGKSQGVIPFLKIVNDTAVAVNQGGKRKGAVCTYLETWHLDILDFLELRKNTGDERRRCHDMNTANWIPDLFMKRVINNESWTLFSPSDVSDLHELYGAKFEERYLEYECQAREDKIQHQFINAVDLWRKMLTMLFETGHPWMTFKDTCNIRSPQQHVGIIHSSNLCTEITLNTNSEEIAVCNLGSVNLLKHTKDGKLDNAMLKATIKTAMRMLDNVVDINFYPVEKARCSNQRHRPVGLGIMGFQDCLYEMGISYASKEAVEFADQSMENICYQAYWASTELAEEKGCYSSFKGSLWDQGILPIDTLKLLAKERGEEYVKVNMDETLDWNALRQRIKLHGMRNSNCVAIAPTATIANIVGVTASIEPTYQHIFVKSNLSGEFTVSNRYLVEDLKKLEIWDEAMLEDIKYFDGRLHAIDRIPKELRLKYQTAFEVEPQWIIECASRRQKWIDQAQSLNLYISNPSGKTLDAMYKQAWNSGLKTTYYLRSLAATTTEKYTTRAGSHNAVQAGACRIDDPDCESCQ